MVVARFYEMRAVDGGEQSLIDALVELAQAVRVLDECLGVDVLRDINDSHRVVFIERWVSVAAHQRAGEHLPKECLPRPWPSWQKHLKRHS